MAKLKTLVDELVSLNDDNLAQRVIANSDVQWCLSELQDMLAADMEPVIRCTECVFYRDVQDWNSNAYKACHLRADAFIPERKPNDFCSRGERRKD